jgi:hypothetical protein
MPEVCDFLTQDNLVSRVATEVFAYREQAFKEKRRFDDISAIV